MVVLVAALSPLFTRPAECFFQGECSFKCVGILQLALNSASSAHNTSFRERFERGPNSYMPKGNCALKVQLRQRSKMNTKWLGKAH
jgi:hypothetical protein